MTERLLSRHPATNSGDNAEQQSFKELFDVRRKQKTDDDLISFFRIFIFYIYNIVFE